MFHARGVIVLVLLFAVALAGRLYRSWRTGIRDEQTAHPLVPHSLLAGAARPSVVFTTPPLAPAGTAAEGCLPPSPVPLARAGCGSPPAGLGPRCPGRQGRRHP